MFSRLAALFAEGKHLLFDYTVVDEAQNISVAQLRFLSAFDGERPNSLFFSGDLGHLAKDLEFRAVVVMAFDDEVIPLQERIGTVTDDSDLEEVYETERHLLYLACTRARDFLLVTSGDNPSEFLDDLRLNSLRGE